MARPILLESMLVLAGCSYDPYSTLDAPKQFFSSQKVGSSADYGVVKFNDPANHVITVHGFTVDAASCREVADALNLNACKETGGEQCLIPYSCIALSGGSPRTGSCTGPSRTMSISTTTSAYTRHSDTRRHRHSKPSAPNQRVSTFA